MYCLSFLKKEGTKHFDIILHSSDTAGTQKLGKETGSITWVWKFSGNGKYAPPLNAYYKLRNWKHTTT